MADHRVAEEARKALLVVKRGPEREAPARYARSAELLAAHGPNALPAEQRTPAWRRFLARYRRYMRLVLVAAAIVSLVIQEWTTAILLIVLTLLNTVPADGRPVEAGALQADEPALTGESGPAAKGTGPAFKLVARPSKAA
ncbi:cation-transporting P-type ATPase [Streptomyces sp. NRRL S-241]|uniref:cation-transporting P-type ATPase n=1 Tax=Streptomyces sp. NRRL S-241 TaxID=1463896 RepID=UPI0004BE65E5|nr:cation-transporting P-type ATPase [Streptomyces sp. NRRL S-241]